MTIPATASHVRLAFSLIPDLAATIPLRACFVVCSALRVGRPEAWLGFCASPIRREASARPRRPSICPSRLAKSGSRTLLVDLDPQCNATSGLGHKPTDRHPLVVQQPLRESLTQTEHRSSGTAARQPQLSRCRNAGGRRPGPTSTLRAHLDSGMNQYDFVLIDCPPSLGRLTETALACSTEVLMPIQCEYFAMEGLTQMIHVIRRVMQEGDGRLQFGGIVLTMYDPELELTREVEQEVREFFGEIVFRDGHPPRRGGVGGAQPRPVGDRLRPARGVLARTSNFAWRYWNVTKERRLGRGLAALLGSPLGEDASREDPVYAPERSRPGRRPNPAGDEPVPVSAEPGESTPDPASDADASRAASDRDRAAERLRNRRQPVPAAARVQRIRNRVAGREPQRARHAPADPGAADRRPIPTDLRRTPPAGGHSSRLVPGAGPGPRGRRSAGGRTGDCREPAAQGPQRDRKGAVVPALPGRAPVHAGRPGPAAEDRPIDDRQSDAIAGTARAGPDGASKSGAISAGHARALLPLGDEPEQIEFCQRIKDEALSVRDVEQLVQERIDEADAEPLGVVSTSGKSTADAEPGTPKSRP